MSKKKDAIRKLWELGNLEYLLKGVQKDIKKILAEAKDSVNVVLASRRLGKCFTLDTKIQTHEGIKEARDLTTRDYVLGLNFNGQLEYTQIKQIHHTGKKEVYDIVAQDTGKIIASCTKEHRWLVWDTQISKERVIPLSEFSETTLLINKPIYETHIKVIVSNDSRIEDTIDIGIDNGTHLYMLANGFITHNSFIMSTYAIETCIKKPNAVVKYVCPQKDMIRNILNPNITSIIKDAPLQFVPEWKEQQKVWLFPNGSQIQLAGADKGNIEAVRGGHADLCICDEAGFIDDLDYVINSVLAPTTDTTNGKIVLISTPNYKDAQHEFHTTFLEPLKEQDKLIRYTLFDSPMVTPDKIQEIISRYPNGINNPKFRCEYLCEVTVDADLMVIPEFTTEAETACVKDVPMPAYRDFYTSADPAFVDLTGVLFGYYDFKEASLVILDELVMNGEGMTTDSLAKAILEKERVAYYDVSAKTRNEPFMRVIDNNNLILVNDLFRLHDLQFVATRKDNKEAQINQLRVMLSEGRIIISPKCKNLIFQLKNVKWDKQRKGFLRNKGIPEKGIPASHCDLVDSILYMVRNVIQQKNPYPHGYGNLSGENVFENHSDDQSDGESLISRLFNRKK